MPTELRPLTDDEIVAIVESEQASAEAWGEELSGERETALDYYYARPLGDEEEGSSQVVSNDVCEVVEWMMPILVRMFCADDELIEFIPSGNDIAGASAATKYVRHVVFTENDGFRLIHDTIKDGILSKVGAFTHQVSIIFTSYFIFKSYIIHRWFYICRRRYGKKSR